MLKDRYGLLLSTTSPAAREAYVEGCAAKLTMYPGVIEAFDRAIAADPGLALAHGAKAHIAGARGRGGGTRYDGGGRFPHRRSVRAGSEPCRIFRLACCGRRRSRTCRSAHAPERLAARRCGTRHHRVHQRPDRQFRSRRAETRAAGAAGKPCAHLRRRLVVHGPSWNGALGEWTARCRPPKDRTIPLPKPQEPLGVHARAHLCYEEGDPNAARAFLASWLPTYPRNGPLYSHLNWHLALGHLEVGDAAAALRLFREAFSPDVHSGPPRAKVTDAVSFLWRWELAGHPRDVDGWHIMHDFANGAFPRAGVAFSDMHIALAQSVAGNDAALDARTQQMDELARQGRYPSGPLVPAVSRAFAAFERGDFSAAIDALEPIAAELERIGGSRAQLDLVEFTLLKAYVGADRPNDAHRMLSGRLRGSSRIPVAGLAAMH